MTLFSRLGFSATSGEAIHLKGANGSGKTSLLRILAGLSTLDHGTIHFNGTSILQGRSQYLAQISYLGHQLGLKSELDAHENLAASAKLRDTPAAMSLYTALKTMEIDHAAGLPCGQLSAGQRQRIALARTLLSNAPLWMLDEPGTALDQAGIRLLESVLSEHVKAGGIAIFTSHQDFKLDGVDDRELHVDQFVFEGMDET